MVLLIRIFMGELFKLGYGVDVIGKLYVLMRVLGFDKVFDINFGVDMIIMEEVIEFIERVKNNGLFLMFILCCLVWVR